MRHRRILVERNREHRVSFEVDRINRYLDFKPVLDVQVIVSKRLAKLREYVEVLKKVRTEPRERFISDPLVYGSAERYTQLAIQVMLDIGSHLVADNRLGDAKYIPKELADRLLPLVIAKTGLSANPDPPRRRDLFWDAADTFRGCLYAPWFLSVVRS